ncbi:MAG: hypothetical protein PHQ19_01790 [Candidatus Krumholzibacteria bacterium]|nr:hypothetical protein [Candidatus Krumholzibacteria bacterium]
MRKCEWRLFVLSLPALIFLSVPAFAYEILLDIDTDNDPATINISTEETSAVVRIILRPTTPGETIGFVAFGIGGECLPCPPAGGVQMYGTSFDLPFEGPWVTAPGFDSEAAYMTLLGCPGNPGFHLLLSFEPAGGETMIVNEPMFLAEFNAWVSPPVSEPCEQPMPVLMAMPRQGEWYNYVALAGAEGPHGAEVSSWGRIKSFYR